MPQHRAVRRSTLLCDETVIAPLYPGKGESHKSMQLSFVVAPSTYPSTYLLHILAITASNVSIQPNSTDQLHRRNQVRSQ